MKQRTWDPKAKAKIVLEGIKGRAVGEICNEYQICVSQYYQWRDQFLSNLDKAFDTPKKASKELRLESEVQKLRALVGELTLELKKSDEVFL
jgi:transposase-like protein